MPSRSARQSHFSVAIVHHEHAPRKRQEGYLLSILGHRWQQRHGIEVKHVYGASTFVPADLAIVHVDLSVVPSDYAALARKYPLAINADVTDIRKRAFSTLVISGPAAVEGAVIVKSDLNAHGLPERTIRRRGMPALLRIAQRTRERAAARLGWTSQTDPYRVYPSAAEVPAAVYRDSTRVVERFVPERRGNWYCHRRYYFLADAEVNQLWLGTKAICLNDVDGVEHVEQAALPPEVRAFRHQFGIHFGKIDYVLDDAGRAIVLDVNKTPFGASQDPAHEPWLQELCDNLEGGLRNVTDPASMSDEGSTG